MNKSTIFDKAKSLINGDRQKAYGNSKTMCLHIANMWNAYLRLKGDNRIRPTDVPMMMAQFKMAREAYKHKEDNLVDMCGYIGLLEKMRKEK